MCKKKKKKKKKKKAGRASQAAFKKSFIQREKFSAFQNFSAKACQTLTKSKRIIGRSYISKINTNIKR